jgi:GNAT superfamily N-acetyltransferase
VATSFKEADFPALVDCWNAFYPEKFALDAEMLRLKTVDSKVFDWGASAFEADDHGQVQGFIAVKRSANPTMFHGPDPDAAHVAAFAYRDRIVGSGLLEQAKSILHQRGNTKIVFGADADHLLPGCPKEMTGLCDFLTIMGFQLAGEQVDVERDLQSYEPDPKHLAPLDARDVESRPAKRADLPALRRFLEREFPGRWTHDVMLKAEDEDPGLIETLWVEGDCEGFALTQFAGLTKRPIGGAVWRLSLGENWGSLGPIGVSDKLRGRGLGTALLAKGLQSLKARGACQTIIDWTTLVDFYGGQGFQVNRTYRSAHLPLDTFVRERV